MARKPTDVLQGTLSLLILKTLASQGPLHGYAIASYLLAASSEKLRVEEGSLYPALHRMEHDGWIRAQWKPSELGRRARVYSLTAAGARRLAAEEERWAEMSAAINQVLRYT